MRKTDGNDDERPDAIRVGVEFGRISGWRLTTQQIHAMVFVAHAEARVRRGRGLCRDVFLATMFGPRSPALTRMMRPWAPGILPDVDRPLLFFKRRERRPLTAEDAALVAEIHAAMRDASPGRLVSITQHPGGPWSLCYRSEIDVAIDDASLTAWAHGRDGDGTETAVETPTRRETGR